MKHLCLALLFCAAASPAFAANDKGEYWTGGGVGHLKCTHMLDMMATVRQQGGFGSPNAVFTYDAYFAYIEGFHTAYNAMTAGIYDIFKGLDNDPQNVLLATEPYCQQHPTETFDDALWDLIAKLYPTPEVR